MTATTDTSALLRPARPRTCCGSAAAPVRRLLRDGRPARCPGRTPVAVSTRPMGAPSVAYSKCHRAARDHRHKQRTAMAHLGRELNDLQSRPADLLDRWPRGKAATLSPTRGRSSQRRRAGRRHRDGATRPPTETPGCEQIPFTAPEPARARTDSAADGRELGSDRSSRLGRHEVREASRGTLMLPADRYRLLDPSDVARAPGAAPTLAAAVDLDPDLIFVADDVTATRRSCPAGS